MKPKIYCPYCNSELRWGDKFCGNCGKPIELADSTSSTGGQDEHAHVRKDQDPLACGTCGTVNKPGTEFCRSCGSDLRTHSESAAEAKPGVPKQPKKDQRPSRKEFKVFSSLGTWKPVVALVIIIIAAVLFDRYVSRENIPQQVALQSNPEPQRPSGANMAAIPQIEDIEQQVKANPSDLGKSLQLANFLSDNRFYDKAITYYQSYLQKKPKDANARVDMGICYKEIGQYENATREMKQALVDDPSHLFATFNLGIVALDEGKMYMDQGQMDRANELIKESNDWFKKTVALAPTSGVGKRAEQLLSQHSNTQLPSPN
jgi:hypothetical protein